jgi:hypothetical protein
MDELILEQKFVTSVFNPELSAIQIRSIVDIAYNEALGKGIVNGVYTTIVNGETITLAITEGKVSTAWGLYPFWDIFKNGGKK